MLAFIAWWGVIQCFGLAALPLTMRLFRWLPDRGYAFAKATGLLLGAYGLWLGASAGLLANNTGGAMLPLFVTAGLSIWVLASSADPRRWIERARAFWQSERGSILTVELLFLLTFAGWALVRAYAPDKIVPAGGEKYMEIAFLNGVLNSPQFPPLDPWLAGYGIAYYYFGYVMMAVMVRLSGVSPTLGFDLYDALTFALTAIGAYGVVANLVRAAGGARGAAARSGLLGALFVGGLGNQEGWIHALFSARLLSERFLSWLSIPALAQDTASGSLFPGNNWWWWRASRVLDDRDLLNRPLGGLQPINEFPFFSFLLGDNHPHKLALPFVLLAIGLALNLLLKQCSSEPGQDSAPDWFRSRAGWSAWLAARRLDAGLFLFAAVLLGGLAFLNTWDFPIYLGLVLLAWAAGEALARHRFDFPLLWRMLAIGSLLGAGAVGLYLFFYVSFSSQAGGVLPYIFPPTRLVQYLIQFAPFIFILGGLSAAGLRQTASNGSEAGRAFLRAWLWITGLAYGTYLLVLLLASAVLSLLSLQETILEPLNRWLGDLTLNQVIAQAVRARLINPWLFLLLSGLLAAAASAVFRTLRANQLMSGQDGLAAPDHSIHRTSQADDDMPLAPAPVLETIADRRVDINRPVAQNIAPTSLTQHQQAAPLPAATIFALLLALTGIGLTLLVEFFYLRDNFGVRINSVFKFYFQGWVLMGCASAYALWWVSQSAGRVTRALFWLGSGLLIAGGLVYPLMGIASRVESFRYPPNLDAAATFAGVYPESWGAHPDDWAAVQWLRQHNPLNDSGFAAQPGPVRILEATALGYDPAGRISAFTGFPTLLGWGGHEGQWRGNNLVQAEREPVIRSIYTTPFAETALNQLREYNIRYVIIGDIERQYINQICATPETRCNPARALGKFDQAFTLIFSQGSTSIYLVPDPTGH